MRSFNITGPCDPSKHYMVKLDSRLKEIKTMVDNGDYFIINRARQYGKTTTLLALERYLNEDYAVVFMDFQMMGSDCFENTESFSAAFATYFNMSAKNNEAFDKNALNKLEDAINGHTLPPMTELFLRLNDICESASKPVVLMIDEVDSASNNDVFIDFLSKLRAGYISKDRYPTFYSVILAGVYDIKNLKIKIRPEQEHRYNSPWNIAAQLDVDMSFSQKDIAQMLGEYKDDRNVGFDADDISGLIYEYTGGYPYLVSYICRIIDMDESMSWSRADVPMAVRRMIGSQASLFDSLKKHITEHSDLKKMLREMLLEGKQRNFNSYEDSTNLALMLGYVKGSDGNVVLANRIFEEFLYNLFLTESEISEDIAGAAQSNKPAFANDNGLNVENILSKYVEYYGDVFSDKDNKFVEKNGREMFLLFLKPIINGSGNYYIEPETRDQKRMDIVIDYHGRQYVIELKIWHGEKYDADGEKQLCGYLEKLHLDTGYMLTYSFNKNKNPGIEHKDIGGYRLIKAVC